MIETQSLKVLAKHNFCDLESYRILSLYMSLILTKNVSLFISKMDWHIAEFKKLTYFLSHGHHFFMVTLWFMSQFVTQSSGNVSELFTFHSRNIGAFCFPCHLKYLLDSMFAFLKKLKKLNIFFSVLECAWEKLTELGKIHITWHSLF